MAAAFPELVSKAESHEELETRDDEESVNTAMDLEDEDENNESDSENEQDSASDSDSNDPWEDRPVQVKDSLRQGHVKEMERFLERGASEEAAKAKAFNALLPVFRRTLRRLYLHHIKWFRRLRSDPAHEKVTRNLRRFVDEDSKKRKFLFNRFFERCAFLRKKKMVRKKKTKTPKGNIAIFFN
jgi:hypothetical protein